MWALRFSGVMKDGRSVVAELDLQLIAKVLAANPSEREFTAWLKAELYGLAGDINWTEIGLFRVPNRG